MGNDKEKPQSVHQLDAGRRRVKSKSVVVEGTAEFIEDFEEKERIVKQFMTQYSDLPFKFNAPAIRNVGVILVSIDKLTAKEFGAKAVTPWSK